MRARTSAGILLYRRRGARLEVLVAHPGGPFFNHQDEGVWTVPKGEPNGDTEDLLAVARREFEEETGRPIDPAAPTVDLGSIRQRGGKTVLAWAVEGDLDPAAARSNTFELEWPRRSGLRATYPEIDRVAWLEPTEAKRRLRPEQAPFVDRLEAALDEAG